MLLIFLIIIVVVALWVVAMIPTIRELSAQFQLSTQRAAINQMSEALAQTTRQDT